MTDVFFTAKILTLEMSASASFQPSLTDSHIIFHPQEEFLFSYRESKNMGVNY